LQPMRECLELVIPEENRVHQELKALLETVVVQRAESSVLRQRSRCKPRHESSKWC
jgi:hypothetical protein